MPRRFNLSFVIAAAALLLVNAAAAQDSPSLGEVARQQRSQKASTGEKDSPKVISNEELPENAVSQPSEGTSPKPHGSKAASFAEVNRTGEHWRSQIKDQKLQISSLQKQIDLLNQSVRFASHPCNGPRCVEWNERQREKQQQVERMQGDLSIRKKNLEEMQESARRQGYGNSVYEPDTAK